VQKLSDIIIIILAETLLYRSVADGGFWQNNVTVNVTIRTVTAGGRFAAAVRYTFSGASEINPGAKRI